MCDGGKPPDAELLATWGKPAAELLATGGKPPDAELPAAEALTPSAGGTPPDAELLAAGGKPPAITASTAACNSCTKLVSPRLTLAACFRALRHVITFFNSCCGSKPGCCEPSSSHMQTKQKLNAEITIYINPT